MKFALRLPLLFSGLYLILTLFLAHFVTASSGDLLEKNISILRPDITIQTFGKASKEKGLAMIEMVDKDGLVIYSSNSPQDVLKKKSDNWKYVEADIAQKTTHKAYRIRPPGGEEEIVTYSIEKGYRTTSDGRFVH